MKPVNKSLQQPVGRRNYTARMETFLSSLATGDPLTDMLFIGAPLGLFAAAVLWALVEAVRNFVEFADDILFGDRRARKFAARVNELEARLR